MATTPDRLYKVKRHLINMSKVKRHLINMSFEEKNNKSVKRLLKELGLWGAWRTARIEYVYKCSPISPSMNKIPNLHAFSNVISNSFVWAEQINPNLWSSLCEMTEHLGLGICPSATEIIENEELLNSVKDFVKTKLNGTK